jgi:hypothetical protein
MGFNVILDGQANIIQCFSLKLDLDCLNAFDCHGIAHRS